MSMSKIQARLRAPKSQTNKFGGYNYRSAEDICEAVKPLLAEYGYFLNISDRVVVFGDRVYIEATASVFSEPTASVMSVSSGEKILDQSTALAPDDFSVFSAEKILDQSDALAPDDFSVFSAGKIIAQSTALAREALDKKGMDVAQITGAASSYARKYALNGLFAIDDTKDPDATNEHQEAREHRFKKGEKEAIYTAVMSCLDQADRLGLKEVFDELEGEQEKIKVWGIFSSNERAAIKELLKDE